MPKTLAGKLAEVMGTIQHIPKLGRNTAQGYDFVRDADVLDKVRDALAERNVAVMVDVSDCQHVEYQTARQRADGGVSWMTTVSGALSFLDGDSDAVVTTGFRGVGADTGDKGYYKAVTGGVKYALLKTFLIPTGDDPEADEQPAGRRSSRASAQPTQEAPQRPRQAEAPRSATPSRAAAPGPSGPGMSVRDAMAAVEGYDKKLVSATAKEIAGTWSFREMTDQQRAAVVAAVTRSAGEGGATVPSAATSPAPDDDGMWAGIDAA